MSMRVQICNITLRTFGYIFLWIHGASALVIQGILCYVCQGLRLTFFPLASQASENSLSGTVFTCPDIIYKIYYANQ